MGNGTRVHHGKQEKATTAHTGEWYIIEYGMKVHQLRQDEGKQENDTSLKTGFSYITLRYITDVKWGVYGPCVVAPRYDVS